MIGQTYRVNDHDPTTCHVCRVVDDLLESIATNVVIVGLEGLYRDDELKAN